MINNCCKSNHQKGIFRETNFLALSLVKTLLSRNFRRKENNVKYLDFFFHYLDFFQKKLIYKQDKIDHD